MDDEFARSLKEARDQVETLNTAKARLAADLEEARKAQAAAEQARKEALSGQLNSAEEEARKKRDAETAAALEQAREEAARLAAAHARAMEEHESAQRNFATEA